MDKNEIAVQELKKGINIAVEESVRNAPFNKIEIGRIISSSDNGYNVEINKKIYEDIPTLGATCTTNEMVKIVVPNNQYNNMFILKQSSGNNTDTNSTVSSVNGKTGNVILNASDVGALSSSTIIPTKTSDLTNDSNFANVSTVDSKLSTHNSSANAHSSLFGLKLNATEASPFIKSVTYDSDTGIITFVSYNNITTTIDLPIENIVSSGYYDKVKQDIVLVLSSGEELRIPASGLVDDYTGGTTNTIQILVSNDNVITANLISGSITKTLLSQELQTSLNSLISDEHTHSNKTILDNTTASYTTEEKNKLSGVENGAEVNIPINNQTPTWTISSALTNLVSGETISVAFGKIAKAISSLINHIANVSNPHGVTKSQVGLSNVANVLQYSASNPPPYPVTSVDGNTGAIVLNDLKYIEQTLSDAQKTQARTNIGAGTSSFSGSYSDLSNKPTIPTVGNGTITITQSGSTKGTFTTNQSGNTTIALTDNNTTYDVATSTTLGLVKSGTDITIDASGNVSVNDNSHNHTKSNITDFPTSMTPISHASTTTIYGVSSSSNYGHAMASNSTPLVAGTASVGIDNGKFAREGHVHPLQTSVTGSSGSCTGNSATATKLQTPRTINGVAFDGTNNITIADDTKLPLTGGTITGNLYGKTIYSNNKQLISYFDLNLIGLNIENFYPITFPNTDNIIDCEIHSPNVSGSNNYNQNLIHFQLISCGWTDTKVSLNILQYGNYDDSEITIGCIGQGNKYGINCVWLRGGMAYRFYCNYTPTLHDSDYTSNQETFSVGTNYFGGTSNANVNILFTPQTTIKEGQYISNSLTCSKLIGTATKATQDASGNVITSTYANSLEKSNSNLLLKSKSGAILSTVQISNPSDEDAKIVIAQSNSSITNTTTSLTNGNIYINTVYNDNVTSSHKIYGVGGVNVVSDPYSNIMISFDWLNTQPILPTISNVKTVEDGDFGMVITQSPSSIADTTVPIENEELYLNMVNNNSVTSSHKISGIGGIKVTSDSYANIVIGLEWNSWNS